MSDQDLQKNLADALDRLDKAERRLAALVTERDGIVSLARAQEAEAARRLAQGEAPASKARKGTPPADTAKLNVILAAIAQLQNGTLPTLQHALARCRGAIALRDFRRAEDALAAKRQELDAFIEQTTQQQLALERELRTLEEESFRLQQLYQRGVACGLDIQRPVDSVR